MKSIRIAFALFCLTAIAQLSALAQKTDKWTRFQTNGAEFSIEMPGNTELFADKDGFTAWEAGDLSGMRFTEMSMLSSAEDNTMMSVETYSVVNASRAMDILVNHSQLKSRKIADLPKGFSGKEIEKTGILDYRQNKDIAISFVSRYYASKKNLYVVTVLRRGAKNATFERFLNSVRFNEANSGNTNISSLTAFTVGDIGVEAVKPMDNSKTPPKPVAPIPDEDASGLVVVLKSRVPYTNAARRNGLTGTVLFSASFQKNGRISRIELIDGLPDGLNRSAFFATIRMKFLPPEKNGVQENTVKKISFGFSIK